MYRDADVDALDQLPGDADEGALETYLPDEEFGGDRRPPLFYACGVRPTVVRRGCARRFHPSNSPRTNG
ncbi:hypothetical protein NJ7G_3426 [Natrinema sp. J7-2]|nr:hypothetical protein NJ7G_3426 [Natrinema sp. J7-2]